jgi:Ala-tRNA(Pro) deacylase
MAIPKKVINFLDKACVKYEIIEHRVVYTATDKAATLRIDEKIIGKTLIVKSDKDYAFVVIPANKNLDKIKLKKIINIERKKPAFALRGLRRSEAKQKPIKNIDFVKEQWMKKNLKAIKIGAIPCFGSLWGFPTFVDRGLLKNSKIIVNSGDYNFSIKISPANFQKLEQNLVVGSFSEPKRPASAKAMAGKAKKKSKKKLKATRVKASASAPSGLLRTKMAGKAKKKPKKKNKRNRGK